MLLIYNIIMIGVYSALENQKVVSIYRGGFMYAHDSYGIKYKTLYSDEDYILYSNIDRIDEPSSDDIILQLSDYTLDDILNKALCMNGKVILVYPTKPDSKLYLSGNKGHCYIKGINKSYEECKIELSKFARTSAREQLIIQISDTNNINQMNNVLANLSDIRRNILLSEHESIILASKNRRYMCAHGWEDKYVLEVIAPPAYQEFDNSLRFSKSELMCQKNAREYHNTSFIYSDQPVLSKAEWLTNEAVKADWKLSRDAVLKKHDEALHDKNMFLGGYNSFGNKFWRCSSSQKHEGISERIPTEAAQIIDKHTESPSIIQQWELVKEFGRFVKNSFISHITN